MKTIFSDFYKGKTVLVTGHTGFKGSWLCIWLNELGAKVIGYALDPENQEDNFNVSKLSTKITDIRADVRNLNNLKKVFNEHKPDIVFHLAAQAIVRESYNDPHYTFTTNIVGTLNVLECVRHEPSVKSCVIITTDKCYKNKEWIWGYRESDELGGKDPYSSSKACAEHVVYSYRKSFFNNSETGIATTRAGNVLGGGDWAKDRIIPDCIRSLSQNQEIIIRNPYSTRPWQHVLEPLYGYLLLGYKLYNNKDLSSAWNFGPSDDTIITVKELVDILISKWGSGSWTTPKNNETETKHESRSLSLNTDKSRFILKYKSILNTQETVQFVVDWYKKYKTEDVYNLCVNQINQFLDLVEEKS